MEGGRKNSLGMMWAFDISKSNFNDTSPPTWPHLMILLKQFNHLTDKELKYRRSIGEVSLFQTGQQKPR